MAVYAPRQPAMPAMGYPAAPPSQHHQGQAHAGPSGSLPAGTKVQVGKYVVRIERFLSEGGFSHVYLCSLISPSSVEGFSPTENRFVLKRMAVPDKAGLAEIRKEVDAMKQLRPHKHVVYFIEASASSLPGGGGYEIFILMEHCPGGGIIDLLNTRLQNRLTESEILKIFSDTCEAVAHMHSQRPIMIHRDLKVENILVAAPNLYKLCDFGSVTNPAPRPPQTTQEIQALEADLNKHTTLQYRAPEMVDVWSRKGVDEKADIWALGVFLYKLCYYTTPFEDQGPLAIMNVQYKMPSYPAYSSKIKSLIGMMLQESARSRPDVWTVYEECCRQRGIAPRLVRPSSSAQAQPSLPSRTRSPSSGAASSAIRSSATTNGLDSILKSSATPPPAPAESVENVVPMRRGRPAKAKEAPASTTVKGQEQSKPSWVVPRAATGDGVPAASHKGKNTPDETDLFAREAAAGFGDSFASPPPTHPNGRLSGTFGDSFAPTRPPAAPAGVVMGSTHGLRPTPVPSRGASRNEATDTLAAVPAAGAMSLAVPSTSSADHRHASAADKITSSVAEAAKAIDAQAETASHPSDAPLPVIHTSHFGSGSHTSSTAHHAAHTVAAPFRGLGHLAHNLASGPLHRQHTPSNHHTISHQQISSHSRPDLVNRGSQTSPALAKAIPSAAPAPAPAAASEPNPRPRPASVSEKPHALRDFLADDDYDDGFEAPVPRSQSGLVDVDFEAKPSKPYNKRLSMPIAPSALASNAANREQFRPRARPSAVEEVPEPALPPRPKPKPTPSRGKSLASLSSDSSDDEPEDASGHHYGATLPGQGSSAADDDFEAPTIRRSAPKAPEDSLLETPNEMGPTPLPQVTSPPAPQASAPIPAPKPVAPSVPEAASAPALPAQPLMTATPDQLPPRPISDISEEDEDVVARRRAAIAKFAPSAVGDNSEDDGGVNRDPFASRIGYRPESPEAKRPGGGRNTGPPLRAPKPQSLRNSAAITSLVSRYETLSTEPTTSPMSPPPSGSTSSKPLPPVNTGTKPAVPAKNITGASTGVPAKRSSLLVGSSAEAPRPSAEVQATGDRPRFRPTTMNRPASPPKASSGPPAAVRRAHIPRQSLGPGQLPPPINLRAEAKVDGQAGGESEEEEERFAGVAHLKHKWAIGQLRRAEQQIRAPRTDYGQT